MWKLQTKVTYAARARILNRFKKNYHGAQGFAILAHSLLLSLFSAFGESGIRRRLLVQNLILLQGIYLHTTQCTPYV